MSNDLKTQQNFLNLRTDARQNPSQPLENKGFFCRGGGVAFVWTISGVALAACGTVEDFLGLDDDGGGGRALHVHKSPVQGARIYFDVDGGGVSPAEMAAQDAQYPQGFISDAEGRVLGVPAEFYGMPFEAHLEGAIDADTGEALSGDPVLRSIPNANGDHLLASPITDFLADKFSAEIEVEQLMAEIQPILPTGATEADVTAFLEQILDPRNYLDGSSGVEALADYLDGETRTDTDVQTEIADSLPMDTPADTLTVDTPTLSPVTLGANDEFVGKIDAVSHAGAVQYSFVESDGSPANVSDFTISARGVISVVTTPTADTTLYIEVSNTDSDDTETVSVAIMVAASTPELGEVDSGLEETSIVENVAGAVGGTDLVAGISVTDATNPDWVIRAPGGFSNKFDVVADGGNWKLVLKDGESLDYEAFSNGVFDVEVWAVEGGVRSNALALSVTVENANDAPVFIPATEANRLTDITEPVEVAENARQGHVVVRVEAHDADGDSVTYDITTGNTGNAFSIDRNGVISVADADALNFESATKTYTLTVTATDSNGATAPQDVTITINITDTNDEAPMVTAPAGTIRTTTGNNDDTPTGYSITVTDADAEATNTFSVIPNDRRFTFEREGMTDTWNLVLLANEAVSLGDFSLGYTATDGANPTTGTIELEAVDTPVRFTAPAAADRTIPLDENNMAGAAVATVMATSSDITGSTTVHIQSFALVDSAGVPVTGGIFNIATSNLSTASASASITITDANALNYEADNSHTIYVLATDTNDEINTLRLTVRVQNLQEGSADYAITEDENNPMLTVALVDSNVDDPDGVVGPVMFRWFTTTDGGVSKTYLGAASPLNTLDISADPDASYGVTVTYRDGQGMDEEFDVLASSVSFDIVPSYNPATHPLIDGAVPATNDEVIPPTAISATGGTGKIEYSIDKDNSVGAGAFQINPNDGRLLVSEDRPAMWDYETISSYVIWIVATDVDDGATEGTGDTARHRVVIDVQNVDEGDATYEITQSTTALEIGTVLMAQPVSGMDDPDGVEPGSISYQWSADGTEIDDATGMTYTLKTGDDLNAIYSVEVMYLDGYNAGLAAGDQVPSMAEASTSPIKLAQSSYTGSIREDGGLSNLPTIEASVDDAAMGSAITYAFVTDADADTTNTAHLGFTIGATDGVIRLVSSTLDHETADSITLTVRVTYDSNGATAGGDQETRDIDVPISIGDLNEHAPELLSSLQVATGPGVMGGLPTLAGATANADPNLDGTADAEYIDGDAGNDEIDGGGGNDHILGGAGNDEITLSSAADNVETIYYRFSSAGSAAWVGSDGVDTITDFRRGEDRLVFIDTDGTPIDLTAFTSASNLGSAGGQLSVKPLFDSATENTLMGVEITFGANKVQINFHSDDDVLIYDEDDDIYTEAAEAYLGARGSDQTFTMGYLESTGLLTDHGLLSAYFGDGTHDNLQVTGDDVATLIPSALISERYTSGDGVFAKVSARDADGTPKNQVARYDITGGTGMALFDIDSDGWISVKAGATLDYATATSHTLIITATDGGTPAMTSAEQTITIGILKDAKSVYRLSKANDILTAELVTPDTDGVVAGSVMYQWFVTDGTSGKQLGGLTTSNTLDTSTHDALSTGEVYGVTVTYDDNANNQDQDVVLLLTSVIEGTLGDDTALAGTADADYIVGGSGDDTITSGGGNDHIWGGPGDDTITLSTAVGTVETIYYFFASTDSDPWLGVDGADTIKNFRRGEDRLIFIDLAGLIDEGSGIDLGTFLSDDNVFDTGGELAINPLNPELTIDGVEIIFGNQESQKLTISYHTTTREQFHDGTSYTTAGEEYLGTGGTGFDTQTDRLSDNTLLTHYFGDGTHDNLQVTDGEANVIWILNPDITVYPDMI